MTYWTPEQEQELRDYVTAGMSSTQIATRLSVTRNAVSGKASRLGLRLKSKPRKMSLELFVKPRPSRQRRPPTPVPVDAKVFSKRLIDLGPNECRWPSGEGSEISFCGKKVEHKPYCNRHWRKAVRRSSRD